MEDVFDEDGALTAAYLAARGYCCGLGCRNCPYLPRHGGLDAVLAGENDDSTQDHGAGGAGGRPSKSVG